MSKSRSSAAGAASTTSRPEAPRPAGVGPSRVEAVGSKSFRSPCASAEKWLSQWSDIKWRPVRQAARAAATRRLEPLWTACFASPSTCPPWRSDPLPSWGPPNLMGPRRPGHEAPSYSADQRLGRSGNQRAGQLSARGTERPGHQPFGSPDAAPPSPLAAQLSGPSGTPRQPSRLSGQCAARLNACDSNHPDPQPSSRPETRTSEPSDAAPPSPLAAQLSGPSGTRQPSRLSGQCAARLNACDSNHPDPQPSRRPETRTSGPSDAGRARQPRPQTSRALGTWRAKVLSTRRTGRLSHPDPGHLGARVPGGSRQTFRRLDTQVSGWPLVTRAPSAAQTSGHPDARAARKLDARITRI